MAGQKFFRKVNSGDDDLKRLQSNVAEAISQVLKNPILNSVLLEGVSLTTGSNSVPHKLDRSVKGWVIVDRTNNASIYRVSSDDKFLTLSSSGSVTVNIFVF